MEKENKSLENKMERTIKISKLISGINCIILAIIICFNIYYNLFYYKPSKRKVDKSNLFSKNSISANEKDIEIICNDLEKTLNIEVEDEKIDEYLILDAINKNDEFGEYKWYYADRLIELFKDNPYLEKENVYKNLLNVEIVYKKRPFFIEKKVAGVYYGEDYNSIGIFTDYPDLNVSLHEVIHCIFANVKSKKLPRFFTEGMTQLLENEYGDGNYEKKFAGFTYPFEVAAVKMLCEVTSPDTVLKAFTYGDMSYIIDEMTNLCGDRNEVNIAIELMGNVLDCYNDDKKIDYSISDIYKKCILVFQKCIDTKYKDNDSLAVSYYYNEMLFYNCLYKDNAFSRYQSDLERYGINFKAYFSSNLKSLIDNGCFEYVEENSINNKKYVISK